MAFRVLVRWAALFGLAVLTAACGGGRGGAIAYQGELAAPDAPTAIVADEGYKLAPLDTVTVTVYQVEDLSKDYTVDVGGRVTIPLIGPVNAIGLSTNELAASIQSKLGERYLRNPNVVVTLKESVSRVITVDGSVRRPGVFPAVRPLTLVQAVALAQGTDELANPRRVAIFRMVGGRRMAAAFDLTDIRRGKEKDPTVYAGDTIVVDGSGVRKAQRDILQSLPLASIFMAL